MNYDSSQWATRGDFGEYAVTAAVNSEGEPDIANGMKCSSQRENSPRGPRPRPGHWHLKKIYVA